MAMVPAPALTFKIASEPSEFEQIYRLNFKTFVEEIPQHKRNDEHRLVDRFDKQSTYIVCLEEDEHMVGMLAVHGDRPFSLDEKLDDLDSYFDKGRSICEIRLLAVEKEYRNGRVFLGLAKRLIDYVVRNGYDMAIISGTTREQKLYRHLGFRPFGPLVGEKGAMYQPMYLTKERFEKKEAMYKRLNALPIDPEHPVSFLPGPVNINSKVKDAFSKTPVSHRSKKVVDDFQLLKRKLCDMVKAKHVEIFLGSGTLGNDVVAGQLSLLSMPGLIISNGEFGRRLIDHGTRADLSFQKLEYEWGAVVDYDEVRETLRRSPEIKWLWAVHCETSTGLLNHIHQLKEICRVEDVFLCLDCCSSIGTVPVDLQGVYLASSSSGKGLSSYAGLSMVFYHHEVESESRLPRYLDLGLYASRQGIPFTHSSNLIYALQTALERFEDQEFFEKQVELFEWLRKGVRQIGFDVFGGDTDISPAIVTIPLPERLDSAEVGNRLDQAGFLLSYRSEYLLKRNWIQISLMGEHSKRELRPLLDELAKIYAQE